jgi:chaperonin cofactor prefoldin
LLKRSKELPRKVSELLRIKQKAEESQTVLTKKLEKAKNRMKRLIKKYKHYKSKAARYFKQLRKGFQCNPTKM